MEKGRKIPIGGIKFSDELVHLRISADNGIDRLLRRIAAAAINLPFLCHNGFGPLCQTSLCVRREDLGELQRALAGVPLQWQITPGVATITIFPHRNSLALFGLLLEHFASHGYPVHSLSTSISAIAINTSFQHLDEIARGLQGLLQLPDNHSPFRQTVRVEQVSG